MSDTSTVGQLSAERGQKVRGWLPVAGTSVRLPITLAAGIPCILTEAGGVGQDQECLANNIGITKSSYPA
jgi:hypothetical protein